MEDDVHPKYFVASGQLACTLHNIFNRGLAADRNTPLKTMYNAVKYLSSSVGKKVRKQLCLSSLV